MRANQQIKPDPRPDLARAANAEHRAGIGPVNLYAISEKRRHDLIVLVAARDADLACEEIRADLGLVHWDTTETVTRSVQRNIDAEPGVVNAFRIKT